jgi:hypothetical protein
MLESDAAIQECFIPRELNLLAESRYTTADNETDQRIYKTMLSLWQNTELSSLERSL